MTKVLTWARRVDAQRTQNELTEVTKESKESNAMKKARAKEQFI